jgi:acetate kinase
VCRGLENLGVAVDEAKNEAVSGDVAEIQKDGTPVKILVIRTDEEREIAHQTIDAIEKWKRAPRDATTGFPARAR